MRLLIVDDEPVIRKGLVKMAQSYKPVFTEIYTAVNGVDAVEKIQVYEPEVMLTDIRMPKADGLELCRTLHEKQSHIQIAVISGYNEFEYAQSCMNYGVKHYLLKPATKAEVHAVLDKLVKQPNAGYVPVSKYVQWIEKMEQSIWTLQMKELRELQEQWREVCLSARMPLEQLKRFLEDCAGVLEKRFEVRGYKAQLLSGGIEARNSTGAIEAFERLLQKTADDLLLLRGGVFKDPIEETKSYIDARLSEEISLEEVASMVGLTPNYFSALFKRMTNETFVQYRIKRRMEKAQELLGIPRYRIVDVAEEVGYDDYSHFTKTFKKFVGISPSEFRCQLGIK